MGFIPKVCPESDFSMSNFPFGIISTLADVTPRCATAIGEYALDLKLYAQNNFLDHLPSEVVNALTKETLNDFAVLPSKLRKEVRLQIIKNVKNGEVPEALFTPLSKVKNHLPMRIGDFTDFVCSWEHMQNCAVMIGGVVPPNFLSTPLAYNGRVSSILPSGHTFRRPQGVTRKEGDSPSYGPSNALDFELEIGFFVSKPIPVGETLKLADAKDYIFGMVLLNDWTTRDIQAFELQPLGPFNSKGFATTISPWIVTLDALEEFACEPPKPPPSFEPAEYLKYEDPTSASYNIHLGVDLIRAGNKYTLSTGNFKSVVWTPIQQLTHHAMSGCGFRTGDLIGTGTISSSVTDRKGRKIALGCLFESTSGGSKPIVYDNGIQVSYLEDYDEIILRGWCGGEGSDTGKAFGFGECRALILPAKQ